MSRKTTPARHRAATNGNLALQGLSRAAKTHATSIGRPVAIVAVTSGLALSAVGTAHAGSYAEQGTTVPAAAVVPAAPAVPAVSPVGTTHTVVAGDTLGGISAGYGVDLTAVLAANGLSLASVIFPGDAIVIPTGGAAPAPAQTVSAPVVAAPVQQVAAVQQAAAVAPAPVVAPAPAVPAAAGSGVHLASAQIAPVVPAGSGVAGTLVASAQAQLAAGTIQDCTVLVEKALRAAGIAVGDLGPSQFFQFGSTVATPAPGDIVITGGHVAIYVGGGEVISSGMNGANLTMQHPLSDLPGASFVRVAG